MRGTLFLIGFALLLPAAITFSQVPCITGNPGIADGTGGEYFQTGTTSDSSIPELISPEDGAVLDNGRHDLRENIQWDFDWSDVNDAKVYHLYVIRLENNKPIIDIKTDKSEYNFVDRGSYIVEKNRKNWTWKVRTMMNDTWGSWSETRTFDIEPIDTDPPLEK